MATIEDDKRGPAIYSATIEGERLHQGELVGHILEWSAAYDDAGIVVGVQPHQHKLAVVLTQDCDLEQDWTARQKDLHETTSLICVLLCPAWPAEELRRNQAINSKLWDVIRKNKNERYQFLASVPHEFDRAGEGHSDIVIDFKSMFAVRTDGLYRQIGTPGNATARRRFRLETPWAEHQQSRFASYIGRIGLPLDHYLPDSHGGISDSSDR